ncbi:MAG TPA: type 1 glutamine amidotransferase domain-containing protein [Labilithrix sp.]|nr:type 1 glutamine amidotransferase domain-containing protein [Labilithrix sp.]
MRPERLRLRGKRVAILAGDGFEYVELVVPKKALERAGASTEIVSLHDGKIRGMNISEPTRAVRVDCTLNRADPNRYDALFIPGGFIGPDFIRQSQTARAFVRAFEATNKPIATICHGPWLLVSTELVKGRVLSSWPGIRDDIVHAGGVWRDQSVVIDRNWVSSRGPQDLHAFIPAMIAVFMQSESSPASTDDVRKRIEAEAPEELSSPPYDQPALRDPMMKRSLRISAKWAAVGLIAVVGLGALVLRRAWPST